MLGIRRSGVDIRTPMDMRKDCKPAMCWSHHVIQVNVFFTSPSTITILRAVQPVQT
jgi:hypothetical protein